jgi:ABC-2 type transport system permease protein
MTPSAVGVVTETAANTSRAGGGPGLRVIMVQAVRVRATLVVVISSMMLGMGLIVGALWPTMHESFADLSAGLPAAFDALLGQQSLSTAVGWANAEMLSMVAPAGVIAVGVISAAKATAGEEEAGTLGILLAAPVSRSMFLAAKELAMIVAVFFVSAAVAVGLLLGNTIGGLGIPVGNVIAASVACLLLGVLYGSFALAVGAWTGQRRLTLAAAGGCAALSFAVANFLPLSDVLASGAKLSPWYYYTSDVVLAAGANYWHFAILGGLSLFCYVLAVAGFSNRDLRG